MTTESVVIIADNVTKDASTVHHFNGRVLQHLKEKRGLKIEKQVLIICLLFCYAEYL